MGLVDMLLQRQQLAQVGLGGLVITRFPADQRQCQDQLAVAGGLGGQQFELLARRGHVRGGQQASVLQANLRVMGVFRQDPLEPGIGLGRLLGQQNPRFQHGGLALVGLYLKQVLQGRHGLVKLLRLSQYHCLRQQQLHIVGILLRQFVDAIEQGLALRRIKLLVAAEQRREVDLLALARQQGHVGHGLDRAALAYEQN